MKDGFRFFPPEELEELRSRFYYVDRDADGKRRLFFDNAGGSLRLKAAEEAFHRVDALPNCSEHTDQTALALAEIEEAAGQEIRQVIFGAEGGVLYPGFTASQIMFELMRVFGEHAQGSNYVTTVLEHPSAFDAAAYYGSVYGKEVRVAEADRELGGVSAESILKLVDRDTAILVCMAASNISGYVYDVETVCREARRINPEIYIIVDAVQHAPHAWLEPERVGADAMHFAPYKFFGVRGFSLAWISDRAASFMHHRLLGKPADEWSIGSPVPAQFAAVREIVRYVTELGAGKPGRKTAGTAGSGRQLPEADGLFGMETASLRELWKAGMDRIASHERALMELALNGDGETRGLRRIPGVKVQMDGSPLSQRDFILGVEFEKLPCELAAKEYEKRGIIGYERSASSIYSKRMLDAFDSRGVVRLSPLHVNTPEEMRELLRVTEEIAAGENGTEQA